MQKKDSTILIGYSGHAFVAGEAILAGNGQLEGYCDNEKKIFNPFSIPYLGRETDEKVIDILKKYPVFISIGSNRIREKVFNRLQLLGNINFVKAIHPSAVISLSSTIARGVLISANATINALAEIRTGAICNTGCIIEHECQIGNFSHIAPGAVLAGNVTVGYRSFVGANSVVKQGVTIGNDVIIGAGTVVLNDIPDNVTVVGNPARIIKTKL